MQATRTQRGQGWGTAKALLVGALILVGAAWASAQGLPGQTVTAFSSPTPDGLNSQFQDLLRARQANDVARLDALTKNFSLPDPGAWITRIFGVEEAPHLSREYLKEYDGFQSALKQVLDGWAKEANVEVLLERWPRSEGPEPSADIPVPSVSVPVETYRVTVGVPGKGSATWVDSFVYLDGAFRLIGIGTSPFWSAPHFSVPKGNFQMAHVIEKVPPTYPLDSTQQVLEGTVRLRATITAEGTVREVKVMDGHPILAEAALEAVSKWRYSPAQIGGRPVEMPTTVEVDFFLPRLR